MNSEDMNKGQVCVVEVINCNIECYQIYYGIILFILVVDLVVGSELIEGSIGIVVFLLLMLDMMLVVGVIEVIFVVDLVMLV